MTTDPFNLNRFVEAQQPIFERVHSELRRGQKQSHWMWFIFPQILGLGLSPMAEKYAIASIEEAAAYLDHPILGPRLRQCTQLVNEVSGRTISDILGYPDDLKFRSSMTLFAKATADNQVFHDALKKYFEGKPDERTLELL